MWTEFKLQSYFLKWCQSTVYLYDRYEVHAPKKNKGHFTHYIFKHTSKFSFKSILIIQIYLSENQD